MKEPKDWKYNSPDTPGFHSVISPDNSVCRETYIFRLNLEKGQLYPLFDDILELNAVVIEGKAEVTYEGQTCLLDKYDSFYLPAKSKITIKAKTKAILFIGGARYEGEGTFFTREYNLKCRDKNLRQVHGVSPFRRDVFMTISQYDTASRLICGITSGDPGMWTSWPPHQHTKYLEEVYCYFDLPRPKFALHLCSRYNGTVEFVHPVSTGSCVIVPEGYHPTVGMPGVKSCYFWVMVAHDTRNRRYDLAENDPSFPGE